jgi:hypothetical protein
MRLLLVLLIFSGCSHKTPYGEAYNFCWKEAEGWGITWHQGEAEPGYERGLSIGYKLGCLDYWYAENFPEGL